MTDNLQPFPATGNPTDLLDRIAGLPVAVLSDAIDSLGLGNTVLDGVRRLSGRRVAGYARTISREATPQNMVQGDLDSQLGMGTQHVIDSCQPDDVIVVAARGYQSSAVWGDNMATRAGSLGVKGVVTDGAVRDLDEMDDLGMTVFAAGTVARQAMKRMITTAIDQPVVLGGVTVRSGDVVVGDGDGVVILPRPLAAAIVTEAERIQAVETEMHGFLKSGNALVAAVLKFKQR